MRDSNKKFIIISILLVLIIEVIFICNKDPEKVQLDEVRLKDNEINRKQFAMYIRDSEDEEYHEYTDNNLFPKGYKLNLEQSGCVDGNGDKVLTEEIITQNKNNTIMLKSNKTVYCYLYFEKSNFKGTGKELVESQPDNLTTELKSDLYRYVGTAEQVTNNYICFGSTNLDSCKETDSEFKYRIIGVDKDGRLKLIKNKALDNKYAWHTNYTDNAVWDSGDGKTSAKLYTDLNNKIVFLNNITYIPNGWKDKIDKTIWNIGDVNGNYAESGGDAIYNQEMLSKSTTPSKIGLMYLSDYYYSIDGIGNLDCTSFSKDSNICETSWLNNKRDNDEFTITRYGQNPYNSSSYEEWFIFDGEARSMSSTNLGSYTGQSYVRPVFYLNAAEKIVSGNGTSDNPFMLENPSKKGIELAQEIFGSVPSGFNTVPSGELYRFIGNKDATINNYICFGTKDASTCKNANSNYLYRIIGVDTNGRLKLIKDTVLNTSIRWHSGYAGTGSNVVWDTGDGKKPSELYTNLNGDTFLNNDTYVPASENWKEKIDKTIWNIGDLNDDSYAQIGGDKILYEIENQITSTTASEIGLMYLSDYYYSLDGEGTTNCLDGDYEKCKSSWLHLSNNGLSQSYNEWTMIRYDAGSYYRAWYIKTTGDVNRQNINTTSAIRPVFYLKSSVEITEGTGTLESPYIIN